MSFIKTGLENFLRDSSKWIPHKRLGLLCNPASVDRQLKHARDLINQRFPNQLAALFSPQHGFFAEQQDNMIESDDIRDPVLNVPVFSLYGKTRVPTRDMLSHIDVLIIDLQDAGTRVYTFIYTMSYCLEAAANNKIKVIILDRPNPVNGISVEGNILNRDFTSFVGEYPIPMRHGLTMGELALMFNEHFGIHCDLTVVPMTDWKRKMYFKDTGLPWIAPSPNLPTTVSALVYPGQVLWEGTNVSEGRGTTQPFEIFGAPFLNIDKITSFMDGTDIPGGVLRPIVFQPTSNKWSGEPCRGFQIHVTDLDNYHPYSTTIQLMQGLISSAPETFSWKSPPYEYEFKKLPIDLITGDAAVRNSIENLDDIREMEKSWQDGLDRFMAISRKFHLYS